MASSSVSGKLFIIHHSKIRTGIQALSEKKRGILPRSFFIQGVFQHTVTEEDAAAGEPEPTGTAAMFGDVPADQYYTKAVAWAVENGVTNGTGDTTFSPDAAVTRAQTVTKHQRFQGSPDGAAVQIRTAGRLCQSVVRHPGKCRNIKGQ